MGSACEAGEFYQAILNDKSEERIARSPIFMIIWKSSRLEITVYD